MTIYLDNAASTPMDPEVLEATTRASATHFANPSSAHAAGAAAARALEDARRTVAGALAAEPSEIVFTGGGTEANALGVLGAAARARGRHLVIGAIEHPAVLRNAERLARPADRGAFDLTLVPAGTDGVVRPERVRGALRPDTALVAIMMVNNELGTVQPIAEIAGEIDRAFAAGGGTGGSAGGRRPHFHVDAVQAFGVLPIHAPSLGVDSLAVSAHKLHGPRGAGALWVRRPAALAPLWEGGGQERQLRSGTENLPGACGFARAVELAARAQAAGAIRRIAELRDEFEARVLAALPAARRTVDGVPRAPHISSLSLPELPSEPLLHALEAADVIASAGAACSSKSKGPSHVLRAIGVDRRTAVLRFSFSRNNTAADVDGAVEALLAAVREVARLAPRPATGY